ncbi:hypothetical protein [Hymenobacter jejuensis]|nr:hypothetical protein [Hymenobacter jejuensis]
MISNILSTTHYLSWLRATAGFLMKLRLWWLASLVPGALLLTGSQTAVKVSTIVLKPDPQPFTPQEFFISDVVDERANRAAVAFLLTAPTGAALPTTPQPVDLQGGGQAAIRQFVQQSLKRNAALRPVTMRIKECQVTETPATKGYVEGRVALTLAFDWKRDGKTIHLTDYRGAARYIRPVGQLAVVEPTLRQTLVESLKYLNTWMNNQAQFNEKLARGIRISFTDYTQNTEDDTLFYTPQRPLTWDDFRATPRVGPYAASVFPSFAYTGRTKINNGVIQVNLTLKAFVVRSSSWVKASAKDAYSLNHEQRHFDLVKLVAEHFKQHVQTDSLTIEDYNSIIPYQYLRAFQEMNRVQEQYDNETSHGLNQAVQESWNQRIEAELQGFSVKK